MWARDCVPSRAGADWILKVDGSAGTEWEAQLAPAEVGSAGVLVDSAGVHPTVRLCWSDGGQLTLLCAAWLHGLAELVPEFGLLETVSHKAQSAN